MSSGVIRNVSRQDIQLVQNLIERCLQLYMNQKEVMDILLEQAKIEPNFTELVWQKLEEENKEFFKAYHLRLMVKEQITIFNKLLERQVELMRHIFPTVPSTPAPTNGSHIPQMQQNSSFYVQRPNELKPMNMHESVVSNIPNSFNNGGLPMNPSMHSQVDVSAASHHNSNLVMLNNGNGMNGVMIKSESGYAVGSPFMFSPEENVETRQTIEDRSSPSFGRLESNLHHQSEQLLYNESPPIGFLGQIPRNFSLSDLTADFSNSDILECYSKSPFLNQGDNVRLDSVSESLSYEDIGSD